jgi:phage terminase small subunit
MALTAKQERFVEEYMIDLNATQAAIRAGYSAKTAKQQGARLLTNVDISSALSAAQESRSERVKVDADWVLSRLAHEADADLADILDEAGAIKPVVDWPLIWRQGLVAGIDVHEEMVDGAKVGQTVKVKLSDRIKRIELIGKHVDVQAFREQVEHKGGISLNVTKEDAEL